MPRYVALLRAVNVGGRKVPMAELRTVLADLGYDDVETYLQSGNATFTAMERSAAKVGQAVEAAIEKAFGFATPVIVTTPKAVAAIASANPFKGVDTKEVHVAFLSEQPKAAAAKAFPADRFAPDELRVGKKAAYLHYPNGVGRSKMTNALIEKHLGVTATTRSWNTVTALSKA